MTMFTAYFDDGGTPDQGGFLVVSGYVASVKNWEQFDKHWRRLLAASDVTDFHMKEFSQSKGQFERWANQEAKRIRFLDSLIKEIALYASHSISCNVDLAAWNEANRNFCGQVRWVLEKLERDFLAAALTA